MPQFLPLTPLPFPPPDLFIEHPVNGRVIPQRPRDGYINATLLCQKRGKLFADYYRLVTTKALLDVLSTDMGIPISVLVESRKGGNNKMAHGTWVHPKVAVNLSQWLSPHFAVMVSGWVFDWMQGKVQDHQPEHVKRYIRNKSKIPYSHFSMLIEIYLNFLAPLEEQGIIPPANMMPDISTGRMFSGFLREKGIDPDKFDYYEHEFVDKRRPPVRARLYPIELLPEFRQYFNEEWLPKKLHTYLEAKFPKALPYVKHVLELPSHKP